QKSIEVPADIRVLPPFVSRRELPSKTQKLRELEGRSAVMIRGMGTEFDSLREYVDGDDVRSIDWRASARASDLVVKTWRPEKDRRVVIVVDSSRLAARRCGEGTVFDAALESSLLLTALATGAGDRVDVIVADARVRAVASSRRAHDPVHDLSVTLTPVHPELYDADWEAITAAVLATTRQQALVVVITALDETTVAEDILPVLPTLTAHHRVVLAGVEDPALSELAGARGDVEEIYTAAAAESELLTAASLRTRLRGLGIASVQAPPDDLPGALADHYIRLKVTGRLWDPTAANPPLRLSVRGDDRIACLVLVEVCAEFGPCRASAEVSGVGDHGCGVGDADGDLERGRDRIRSHETLDQPRAEEQQHEPAGDDEQRPRLCGQSVPPQPRAGHDPGEEEPEPGRRGQDDAADLGNAVRQDVEEEVGATVELEHHGPGETDVDRVREQSGHDIDA